MTKLLSWRKEWSLGIDALDVDHRALVGTLIDISLRFCPQAAVPAGLRGEASPIGTSAMVGSASAKLLVALVDFEAQVKAHLRREEAFMRAIHYPGVAEHTARHAALLSQYNEMLNNWRASAIEVFDESAQECVRHWLMTHVLEADRKFAEAYFELCGLADPVVGQG